MTRTVVATSRVRRAAGLVGAGLGAVRRSRATNETVRRNASLHLAARLGRLRGLPQKMGQLLSMSDDETSAEAFAPLTGAADPVPLDDLRPVLAEAWGRDPDTVLQHIEPHGLAASLGQVHRAVLHDGRTVAIKIQYPGIREAVDADLKLLGWLSEPMGGLRRGFDLAAYRAAIRASLDEELDYRIEAEHQRAYAAAATDLDVIVPEVVSELSGARVLTTVWEDGETLEQACAWPPKQRAALGRQLVRHALTMLFDHDLLHGDPHPGNYRFRCTGGAPTIVLYDFGCVRTLPRAESLALLRLIHDTHHDSTSDPYPLFLRLGFDPDTLEPLRARLPALCRVLFEPFSSPARFDLKAWDRGTRISDILGDDRWNFRISGPAHLIFLMRCFHGLTHALGRLGEPVTWTQVCAPLMARHEDAMRELELPVPPDAGTSFGTLAEHLCIRVSRGGATTAKVSLPAAAVEDLESVMSEDVRARIEARGIDVPSLVRTVRARHYAPQSLFDLEDGDRRFEVWLQ